ncbi:MAG: hypothetical protein LBS50_06760 [Prevotellaceae bacterium]|nr:hypothetical protein [Prevotellaceae bacterium]
MWRINLYNLCAAQRYLRAFGNTGYFIYLNAVMKLSPFLKLNNEVYMFGFSINFTFCFEIQITNYDIGIIRFPVAEIIIFCIPY